ncbi:MAG TPA: hypothetical protein VFZ91_13390 [Allosphingosinicella sp.]
MQPPGERAGGTMPATTMQAVGRGFGLFGGLFVLLLIAGSLTLRNAGADGSGIRAGGLVLALFVAAVLAVVETVGYLRRVRQQPAPQAGVEQSALMTYAAAVILSLLALNLLAIGYNFASERGWFGLESGRYSYGPAHAREPALILAPGVSVEILPSAASLGNASFDRFDISKEGVVVVREGARLVDMASGEALIEGRDHFSGFAFAGDGLALVNYDGDLGYYDGAGFRYVGRLPFVDADLAGSNDRSRLLIHRLVADPSGRTPAIIAVREGRAARALSGSRDPIDIVADDGSQAYYAVGSALYRLARPGRPELLLTLPGEGQHIVGIAAADGALYFSTTRTVYFLADGLVLPLAIGIGGRLRLHGPDLYVLHSTSGRVFRIALDRPGENS